MCLIRPCVCANVCVFTCTLTILPRRLLFWLSDTVMLLLQRASNPRIPPTQSPIRHTCTQTADRRAWHHIQRVTSTADAWDKRQFKDIHNTLNLQNWAFWRKIIFLCVISQWNVTCLHYIQPQLFTTKPEAHVKKVNTDKCDIAMLFSEKTKCYFDTKTLQQTN